MSVFFMKEKEYHRLILYGSTSHGRHDSTRAWHPQAEPLDFLFQLTNVFLSHTHGKEI
jgi:hypothetical protein